MSQTVVAVVTRPDGELLAREKSVNQHSLDLYYWVSADLKRVTVSSPHNKLSVEFQKTQLEWFLDKSEYEFKIEENGTK